MEHFDEDQILRMLITVRHLFYTFIPLEIIIWFSHKNYIFSELKRYRFLYSNDDSSNQVALTHFEPSGGSIAFCKDITIKEIIYFAFKLERQIERW